MARSDFLSINTPVQSLEVLQQKEFNIALAYDLDFKMPPVVFVDKKPQLQKVDGDEIYVVSHFDGTGWDYSAIVLLGERLMNKNKGPIMQCPMYALTYSCNFNKLPCAHQIKRFGDWLNSIGHREKGHYGFKFILSQDGVYYAHIDTNIMSTWHKPLRKAMNCITTENGLGKGFAAAVCVLDSNLQLYDIVSYVGDTITDAFMKCYSYIEFAYANEFAYRTDGGIQENSVHIKLQRYIAKRRIKNANKVAV